MAQYESPEERMVRHGGRDVFRHLKDFVSGEDKPKTKEELEREKNRKAAEKIKEQIQEQRERKRRGEASRMLGVRG
jgi:hypothetical protein